MFLTCCSPMSLESEIELVADLVPHNPTDADPAGLVEALQSRRHVDPVAVDVVRFGNHISKINPNPEGDPLVLRRFRIALSHPPLDLGSAPHRFHDAGKLRQHSVASVLNNPAA